MMPVRNNHTDQRIAAAVKEEQVEDGGPTTTASIIADDSLFVKLHPRQAKRRGTFPPGCHVLVNTAGSRPNMTIAGLPPLICGLVEEVGSHACSSSNNQQQQQQLYYKVKLQQRRFIILDERRLQFAPGTPVSVKVRKKFSPSAVILAAAAVPSLSNNDNNSDLPSANRTYTVQINESGNNNNNISSRSIHDGISQDKIKYRFLWENDGDADDGDKNQEATTPAITTTTTSIVNKNSRHRTIKRDQQLAQPARRERSPLVPPQPPQMRHPNNNNITQEVESHTAAAVGRRQDDTAAAVKQEAQDGQQETTANVQDPQQEDQQQQQQRPPPTQGAGTENNSRSHRPLTTTTITVAVHPPRMDTQAARAAAMLEIRRDLVPTHNDNAVVVLNESPCLFDTIDYSTQHRVEDALQQIRQFIQQHGDPSARHKYGGVGIHLQGRCLAWHVRGHCRRTCHLRADHRPLLRSRQQSIERALDQAIGRDGPIYCKAVTDATYDRLLQEQQAEENRKAAAAVAAAHASAAAAAQVVASAAASNAPGNTARKRQKRGAHKIFYSVPACFGEEFFQHVLCQSDDPQVIKIQTDFDCSWDLLRSSNDDDNTNLQALKLALTGDDLVKLLECRFEMERLLCDNIHKFLRPLLLMELERLNKMSDSTVDAEALLIQSRSPSPTTTMAASSANMSYHPLCWFTSIRIGTATDHARNTLLAEDAKRDAPTLRCGYRACHIGVHDDDIQDQLGHPLVPSHVVICGAMRLDVERCRNNFFSQAQMNSHTSHDNTDDEGW